MALNLAPLGGWALSDEAAQFRLLYVRPHMELPLSEIVTTILWSAPLSACLLSALVWALRNWVIQRLSNSIKHEYDKELESHKAALKAQFDSELEIRKAALKAQSDAELEVHKANAQRLIHIDRSHFDMELESSKRLWSAVSETVDLTVRTTRLYGFTELPEGKGEKRKYAMAADTSFFSSIKVVQELRPFIPRSVHELARSLVADCKSEIDCFFGAIRMDEEQNQNYDQVKAGEVAQASGEQIVEQWHVLADAIQTRLQAIPGEQVRSMIGRENAA